MELDITTLTHFFGSYFLSDVIGEFLNDPIAGACLSFSLGTFKELTDPVFSVTDLGADALGCGLNLVWRF